MCLYIVYNQNTILWFCFPNLALGVESLLAGSLSVSSSIIEGHRGAVLTHPPLISVITFLTPLQVMIIFP